MASLDGEQPGADDQADAGEDTALPDFFTEDGVDNDAADENEQALVAAE